MKYIELKLIQKLNSYVNEFNSQVCGLLTLLTGLGHLLPEVWANTPWYLESILFMLREISIQIYFSRTIPKAVYSLSSSWPWARLTIYKCVAEFYSFKWLHEAVDRYLDFWRVVCVLFTSVCLFTMYPSCLIHLQSVYACLLFHFTLSLLFDDNYSLDQWIVCWLYDRTSLTQTHIFETLFISQIIIFLRL